MTKVQATSRPDYFMARSLVEYVEEIATERKKVFGNRKADARQCSEIERHLLHRSGRHGVQGPHGKKSASEDAAGIRHALQYRQYAWRDL